MSESLMTCRNSFRRHQNRVDILARDEPGGCLFIAQVVSGMEVARAWVRLLRGTWEPVLRRRGQRNGHGAHWPRKRDAQVDETMRARVARRSFRDGPSGSSDEGPVMGLEGSGRIILAWLTVNHECVGGAGG